MKRAIAALIAVVIAARGFAWTDYKAYMKVKGDTQGQFHGAGRSKSHLIPVINFTQKMSTKKSDKNTLSLSLDPVDINEFRKAMQSRENLSDVSIDILKPSANGRMTVAQTMKITNAKVTSVVVSMQTGKKGRETEKVTMTFQKIRYVKGDGRILGLDSWKN